MSKKISAELGTQGPKISGTWNMGISGTWNIGKNISGMGNIYIWTMESEVKNIWHLEVT